MRGCTEKSYNRGISVVKLRHCVEQVSDEFGTMANCVSCNVRSRCAEADA